jgi:hypothetical protein
MNFISMNSNWKFELNKSIEKRKIALFLWAKTGQPKSETGASSPLFPPMARQSIPANTGDEVGQGVAGDKAWTKGDRWGWFDGEALTVVMGRRRETRHRRNLL